MSRNWKKERHAEGHQHHLGGSPRDSDDMRLHQHLVEDFHPHGSYRRRGWSDDYLFYRLLLQSLVVAIHRDTAGRNGGVGSHDIATALTLPSRGRILRWAYLRILCHLDEKENGGILLYSELQNI